MKRRISVDTVAFILAIALMISITMIMTAVIINVADHQTPTQTIGENATQIVIAIIGGLIGVLGSYIGFRSRNGKDGNGGSDANG